MAHIFEGVTHVCREKVLENGERIKEQVDITQVTSPGCVIGLYFSSYWCPPCREFTPQLVDWYNRLNRTDGIKGKLEIILACDDQDQKLYDVYFGSMPWLALPYNCKQTMQTLGKKFSVSKLPSLILIDCQTGSTITRDGINFIAKKPNGEGFPWQPNDFMACLPGNFINNGGKKFKWETIKESKVIGLYFSANTYDSCFEFNSQLVDFYHSMKKCDSLGFEVVFVSTDNNEESSAEFYKDMPWLSIPYSDSRREDLKDVLDVTRIPMLILIDPHRQRVITTSGKAMVVADPEGKEFPWSFKSVELLHEENMQYINDDIVMIWFTDGSTEQMHQAVTVLTSVSQAYTEKYPDISDKIHFIYANGSDTASEVLEALELSETYPQLIIFNSLQQMKYICDPVDLSVGKITQFIQDYKDDKIEGIC